MSGLTHLGVELDHEEAQDVIDNLQDLVNLQEKDIERLAEALKDAMSGLRYIRERYGELDGVGWQRVEDEGSAALREAGVTDDEYLETRKDNDE